MKVKEYQYFKYNPLQFQCRVIEVDNWNDYVVKFRNIDGFIKDIYPPLPRCSVAKNIVDNGDAMTCEYCNQAFGVDVIHSSEIVGDNERVGVLNEYRY